MKLGLALQVGFPRMNGRLPDAVRIVPPLLWRHPGEKFAIAVPDLPPSEDYKVYPDYSLPPYHYKNPVTGRG